MRFLNRVVMYWPLVALVLLSLLFAGTRFYTGMPETTMTSFMHDLMGAMLCLFAAAKLLNWPGFVEAFMSYDILGTYSRTYAYAYPLVELALGSAFIMQWVPCTTYIAMFIVSCVNVASVTKEMLQGKQVQCACLGAVFVLPLTWVSFFEYSFMAAMSAYLFYSASCI